jgi:ferredoxin-NADP reductase
MAASPSRSIWSRVADVASLAATPLRPSDYLALVTPLRGMHGLRARIESIIEETDDARTLVLRPGRAFRLHRAGQFVRIGAEIDGRLVNRTYSISSPPDPRDGRIAITVKRVPGGKMSTHLARDAKAGEYVTVDQAQGDFVLPDAIPARLLFLTAGSGITPVASMVRALAAQGAIPNTIHVHYAPRAKDAIFGAELADLAARVPAYRFALITTREGSAARRAQHLDRARLDALVPDWATRTAWTCGPEAFLTSVEGAFAEAGQGERLNVERFRPRLAPADPNATGGRVRFGLSRAEVDAQGNAPLLDVAERAGVRAPHGCRIGICHSCDTTLVSGCVRDLRTGARIDEPGARVQVCVCAAAGDVELAL